MAEWKETEFGQIPIEWDLKRVDDLKSSEKSAIAMGPFGSNIKAENFVLKGVPVIRGTNLNYYKYVGGDFVFLTEEKANELINSNCKAGDLVFTHRGTIGQVGLIPIGKYPRYVVSQSGMKLTVDSSKINNEFLFYFFKSKYGQYQLLKSEAQVGVPSIHNPLSSLKEIEVPIPPLPEQRAIASILSSLDDKIDLLHRQNKTLEQMAETLFRQWFVEEAEEQWEEKRLGDVAINVRDIMHPNDAPEDMPYVGLEHIGRKNIVLYENSVVNEVISHKAAFKKGDILFGKLRPYFHKVCFAPFNGVCSTDVLVVRSKNPMYSAYCLFAFFQKEVVDHSDISSEGTRMPRTSWEILRDYPIKLPSDEILQKFNSVVDPMIEKMRFNRNQIRTLTQLRDTLLPKLMSGEVRVKVN